MSKIICTFAASKVNGKGNNYERNHLQNRRGTLGSSAEDGRHAEGLRGTCQGDL